MPQSQRPAHQQVSTRPATAEEIPLDTMRVPSAATEAESQADAINADPDRYEAAPAITATDPFPSMATDIANSDEEAFTEFDDISTRGNAMTRQVAEMRPDPIIINRTASEQAAYDLEFEPVIPLKTLMRTNINGKWWNFIKGQEQFVPHPVAEHMRNKGIVR